MALKYVAVSVLNKVLGKYIKDLDAANLELKILSGEVQLTDLELRDDALDDLDLLVEVIRGYVGKIELKIPWLDIYSQPCEVSVHDVYLVAGPVKGQKYNPERARAAEVASKRKRLKKIEEANKTRGKSENDHSEEEEDSFFDKLTAQVLKNLQVSVGNIHICYEDKVTSTSCPFVVGITLKNLTAETTDEFWKPTIVDASVKVVHKLVSLEYLSVYWNTQVAPSGFNESSTDWKSQMRSGIAKKGYTPEQFQYILKPLSEESHVIMDQTTQVVMDTPKMLIEMIQQELSLCLSHVQFQNMMEIIDSFQLMAVNELYRKYQPDVSVKEDPKAWWLYSFTAICEDKIRSWSWERIKGHREKYRRYKTLYKMKLSGLDQHDKVSVLEKIQELEDDLDIPTLLVSRQHAKLEVEDKNAARKDKDIAHEETGGWLEWFGFGGGSHEGLRRQPSVGEKEEKGSLMTQLSVSALPTEEKDKLYAAIDYSENAVPIVYPLEYVKRRLTFNLDSCKITLTDTSNREVAQVVTDGFEAALEQRPGSKALRFLAKVNSFKVMGSERAGGKDRACLVTSQNPYVGKGKELMHLTLETNPMNTTTVNVTIDYLVKLAVEPVEVTYDDQTIDGIIRFFTLPDNSALKQIEAAAINKLEELRNWTRAGLEYAITQHKTTYIDMDVRSPYIVVPEYGSLESDGSVLIIDLGHLKVVSDLVPRDESRIRNVSDSELEKMFYDKFNMTLSDVQILLAEKSSDWRGAHKQSASKAHILPSCGLDLQLYKSISTDYPDKPEFKMTSVVPSLHLKLSDEKFKQLMKFLKNLPLGLQGGEKQEEEGNLLQMKDRQLSSSRLSLADASNIQEMVQEMCLSQGNKEHSAEGEESESEDDDIWFDAVESVSEERPASRTSQAASRVKLTAQFTIEQLLVTLEKESSSSDQPYLSFVIKKLSTEIVVHPWDLHVEAKLGFISLIDNHYTDIDGSPFRVFHSSADKDWILVTYSQADPEGPEFVTRFNSVEKRVLVKFASLSLTAKQEAIASFQQFVLDIFHSLGEQPMLPAINLPLAVIPEHDLVDTVPRTLPKAKKRTDTKRAELIGMQIRAQLNEVSLTLNASGRHVGKVNISGLNVDIDVQDTSTNIAAKLKEFSVHDVTENTLYPEILSLDDNQLFDCKITLFNKDEKVSAEDHSTAPDLSVDLELGRMRFVFLNRFVAYIQNFIHALASSDTTAYAQDITRQVIKAQAKHIQSQGTKIGLNINIRAPTLVIPCHSQSRDMLVADLGQVQVTNSFSSSSGGLFENMSVALRSFQVKGISEQHKHLTDYIVEPIRLDLGVKRKLYSAKKKIPLVDVKATLESIQINLTVDEFKMLMMIVSANLQEGEKALVGVESEDDREESDQLEQNHTGVKSRDRTDAGGENEEEFNIRCNLDIDRVTVNSPAVIDNKLEPYLLLDITKLSSAISLQQWTIDVHASLGDISLMDLQNRDLSEQPVRLLSSVEDMELIKVDYKRVEPSCPEFETTYCSIDEAVKVKFSKVKINLLQQSILDLEEHVLALLNSEDEAVESETKEAAAVEDYRPAAPSVQQNSVSFKFEVNLDEVEVNVTTAVKPLADIHIKGLQTELLLWEGGIVVKSAQRDLSVTDLDSGTIYPEIVSVENENVFDFVFKYFAKKEIGDSVPDPSQLTKSDGSLELNVGRINVVFLYRFINDLLQFVQPLASPQSTKYMQDATQKTVATQVESMKQQGTRILLDVQINAPLVIMPRHSTSVDMLIADLGHLELQNEFVVFELEKKEDEGKENEDSAKKYITFDVMELTLQSVQLSRGVMDASSSAVVKRHLIEPIKLDATIHRSLKPSCHTFPALECKANMDYVKLNLGQKDYQLLTQITQENMSEGQTSATGSEEEHEEMQVDAVVEAAASTEVTVTDPAVNPMDLSTYITMLFSFNLQGVHLTMYSHEKDLDPFDSQSPEFDPSKALCYCDVGTTSVTVELPSDQSVHVHGQFHGVILEDIRTEGKTEFPRLLDKKFQSYASSVTSTEEMCEVWFRQTSDGKMKVEITLQNAAIYVNLPFIWPLLEFFTDDITTTPARREEPRLVESASQTSLDAEPRVAEVTVHRETLDTEVAAGRVVMSSVAAVTDGSPSHMQPNTIDLEVHGLVKDCDIVLLGEPLKKDSSALVLQTEVHFDFTMVNENQQFTANLTNFQMISCKFPDVSRTSYKVLRPCVLEFSYRAPGSNGKGLEVEIEVQPMKFELSPVVLNTLFQVLQTISGQKLVEESVQTAGDEQILAPDELWAPRRASPEYWYQRKAIDESKPLTFVRKTTGEKVKLMTKDINIVLVDEFEGAHVPLLSVTSVVNAKAADWSSQVTLESDLEVEISYYNDKFATWEPFLEPEITDGESVKWGLQLKMFMADGHISSFTPDVTRSGVSPPCDVTDAPPTLSRQRFSRRSKKADRKWRERSALMSCRSGRSRGSQKGRRPLLGTTSDDEADLDVDGAMQHFVACSADIFCDVKSDVETIDETVDGLDQLDGPDSRAPPEEGTKPQAVYIVVNSQDKMQLTVTPVALDVVKRLTEVWSSGMHSRPATPPGPAFVVNNTLGIHAKVSISAQQQLSMLTGYNLTLNQRKAQRAPVGAAGGKVSKGSMSDVVLAGMRQLRKNRTRLFSEPLFDRFRERVEKIKRKRAMSEPSPLEAVDVKMLALKSPALSEGGRRKKLPFPLKKSYSTDANVTTPCEYLAATTSVDLHICTGRRNMPCSVDGFYCVHYVPISVGGQFWYQLQPNQGKENRFMIVQVDMRNGRKIVTIRAPLQFLNHLDAPVEILTLKDKGTASLNKEFSYVVTIDPNKSEDMPLKIAHERELYVRLLGYEVCATPISWKKFSQKCPSCIVTCHAHDNEHEAHSVKVFCQSDSFDKVPAEDAPHHVIHLYPPLIIHNMLPVQVSYVTRHDHSNSQETQRIPPGGKSPLATVEEDGSCQMIVTVDNYHGREWSGVLNVWKDMPKNSQVVLKTDNDANRDLVLSIRLTYCGTTDVTIYSPYWLINKTALSLEYKVTRSKRTHHQYAADKCPLMLSYRDGTHRKAKLRVEGSAWSEKFALDAVGDFGQVSCKDKRTKRKYEFVLQIDMSRTGITKIITITPKYVIINKTLVSLSYKEVELKGALWSAIESEETVPFWPLSKSKKIYLKPTLSVAISKSVDFSRAITTVLRMPGVEAICVDVQGEGEGSVTTIVLMPYASGIGTIRVENLCDDITIRFGQKNVGQVTVLRSTESILYTWDDPNGSRKVEWKSYKGEEDPMEVVVDKDSFTEFQIELHEGGGSRTETNGKAGRDGCCSKCQCVTSSATQEDRLGEGGDEVDGLIKWSSKTTTRRVYVLSLLDGLQRVLLFTEDKNLAQMAQKSSDSEMVTMEVFVSLDGLGLSLVNNKPEEVSYITLSSSSSIWQVEKTPGSWKTLNLELSSWLEDAWNNEDDERVTVDDKAAVDFSTMHMVKPHDGAVRRLFEPAVWLHYSSSEHYQSIHCKMFRIQVDNQLYTTVFPVALYPAPLPVGVAKRTGPKPFIEASVICHHVPNSSLLHFKYARALVQEMNVKLDKGFIVTLSSLFTTKEDMEGEEKLCSEDLKQISVPLKETEAVKAALQTQRVLLENFHLSPLKVNLSFSLISELDEDDNQKFTEDLLDFFIDSVGATLTEINDAQLKLGYFERTATFVTPDNLVSQIIRHYTMQGIRQVYVIVLGLDVLGNPYGFISELGEGVKDLFYEPYQGIVDGPQEFAEGLARGVRSLLGHAVGGTAGAMSRITGTLGQAVATLTFDSDYRKRRRRNMHREPSGFGQGVAMGGKSLAMGLLFGISGVVMKPIEGAQSEGVEGFFKGIGKGLLGLLWRPTGGVIDMVSFTLDGIRRSAEQGGEDIACRMRIPRFTSPNLPLKPFSKNDAEGYGILKTLPHSLDVYQDVYVYHAPVGEADSHHLLLLTDRRVLFLHQTKFWKEWSMEWSSFYQDIDNVRVCDGALIVTERNESGLPRVREIRSEDPEILHCDYKNPEHIIVCGVCFWASRERDPNHASLWSRMAKKQYLKNMRLERED